MANPFFGGCSRFHNTPKSSSDTRYVVISPVYNEIIWALGAQDKVVGVDLSTTYPPEVKNVQTVGYHRALSAEGILDGPPRGVSCRYLFLDEPLTFLDIRHQIDFMRKIREFAAAVDVVTVGVVHDLNLAARFADHIVLLSEARIVASGTATEVLTAERIHDVFGVKSTFVHSGDSGVHFIFN